MQGEEPFAQQAAGGLRVLLGAQEDLDGLPEGVLVGGVDGQDLFVLEEGHVPLLGDRVRLGPQAQGFAAVLAGDQEAQSGVALVERHRGAAVLAVGDQVDGVAEVGFDGGEFFGRFRIHSGGERYSTEGASGMYPWSVAPSMPIRSAVLTVPLFAVVFAHADLSEALPCWWTVPIARPDAIARPDIGLPGQPETAAPISDMAAQGGAYTRVFLGYVPQDAHDADHEWARRATRFGLETVVGIPGGFAMGIDAIDDQLIHRVEGDDARWELTHPRGGLRLGVGANILHALSQEQQWIWGWSVWAPLFDRTGELEVQTGLRHARQWRLDGAWATRWLRQKARRVDSLLDTTTLRSEETRLSLRLGGQTRAGSALQMWGGWRRLEDPRQGEQDYRSVRLASESFYLGAQGSHRLKAWDLDWETRFDRGDDTLRSGLSETESVEARVEHTMVSGQVSVDAPWWGPVRPRLEGTGAFLDLSNGSAEGRFSMLPQGISHDGGGSILRLGAAGALRVRTRWVDVTPRVGLHRVRLDGPIPQVWSGLWPLSEGSAWLGELGGALSWSNSASRASYRIGWLTPLAGSDAVDLGFSHRLEIYQGF